MSLQSGTQLGPHEISSLIGAGGMGEVYRARDTRLRRTVALKILPGELSARPELRERFEREAQAISALNHPAICTLHDVGATSRSSTSSWNSSGARRWRTAPTRAAHAQRSSRYRPSH